MNRLTKALALLAAAWLLAIYLPGIGTGLVKDDFAWIEQSRAESLSQLGSIFAGNTGFYRPAVALSFTVDHALFGIDPLPYGLTNLLLLVLAALAIGRLARALDLPDAAAVMAAGRWALNPHGINMALLWTSGRTALLLTLFAVLAATAFVRRHVWRAGGWALLAMLSKEEATVLPFVLLAWGLAWPKIGAGDGRTSKRSAQAVVDCVPLFVALAAYAVLRWNSGAFTPASAPPYYRFTADWRLLAFNAVSYLDRAATFPVALTLVSTLAARRLPPIDRNFVRLVAMGVAWLVGGYALTVFLPIRSSLYACFPSVGAALIAAAWLGLLATSARRVAVLPVVAVLVIVAAASLPAYWARNGRWLAPAALSRAVMSQLRDIGARLPPGAALVLYDRPEPRSNLAAAFGTLLPQATALATGRHDIDVWVEPPPGDWMLAGWRRPGEGARVTTFVLKGRQLERR